MATVKLQRGVYTAESKLTRKKASLRLPCDVQESQGCFGRFGRRNAGRGDAIFISQGKLVVEEEEFSLIYLYTQIKQAFRKKSLQCHPDLCPPSQRPSAELAFRELAEAYAALSKGVAGWLHAMSCSPDASFHCMSC